MNEFKVSLYKLKDSRYQVDFINPIDKKRKRRIFTSYKEAKTHKAEIESKFHQRNLSVFLNLPIGKIIEIHLKECPKSKMTSRTRIFREFYDEFSRHKLDDLTTSRLREWFQLMKKKYDYSDKTLLHAKIALTHFFRWLVEEEIMSSSPLAPIKFKSRTPPKRPRVYFSVEEIRELLDTAKNWSRENYDIDYFYPFLYILAHTGARRSEILKLKWNDVDFKLNVLNFRHTKVGDDRAVIMSAPLRAMIESLPRKGSHVLTDRLGDKLTSSKVCRHLECFREDHPNGKRWGYHALRHSFAYNYLKKGGEMYQLQAILGHYKITSTINIYGRIKASDVENPSPYDF
ncbi:MAG: hypothetical protein CME65_00025 [Halobacteriovoraceae bacterium]|nr:hypothetical protein [Halobacteriovoraceae bacterium]